MAPPQFSFRVVRMKLRKKSVKPIGLKDITIVDDAKMRKAITAAALGNAMEWFDFGVYGFVAYVLGKVFFPNADPSVQMIAALATFSVPFLIRPLGGLFFGALGDKFGRQKINLRPISATQQEWFTGKQVAPGSDDLCFLTRSSPQAVADHLRACGVPILEGPVQRTGALGPITSVYFRDPDQKIQDLNAAAKTKVGEEVSIVRFTRFQVGETAAE